MGPYFSWDYAGGDFHLWSPSHLATLFLVAVGCAGLIIFRRRFSPRARRAWRYGMAAVLVVNEVAGHFWYWAVGVWHVNFMLPLHLCSLFVWLTAIELLSGSRRLFEFTYFLGIGGALQALITPDLTNFGFPHYRFFQAFFMHATIVLGNVFMAAVEGYRPTAKSLLRVAVGTNVYMVAILGVNKLLGSNYLFVSGKPALPTMLDLMAPWPWYILEMEAVGAAVCLLLYLPFAVRDWRARRRGVETTKAQGHEEK